MNDEDWLMVGEFAKKAGVTVRTLQYYDKCGLLSPELSPGGRRMYNSRHIVRLQQILFLKSFGFSLEEIKSKLLPVQSSQELESILISQRNVLINQIAHLQEAVDMMGKVIREISAGGEIGIEKLLGIMNLLRQGNPYSFIVSHYFENEQVKHINNKLESSDDNVDFNRYFKGVVRELLELYKKGADPAGPEGQALAAKWWKMVTDFTGGDSALLSTLITAGRDADHWPDDAMDLKLATKMFLGPAFSAYFKEYQFEQR